MKLFKTNLEQAEKQGISVNRHNSIDDICKDIITLQFIILDICSIEETWKGYDHKTFFLHMAKAFGDLSGMNNLTPFDHVRQWIVKSKFNFNPKDFTTCIPYIKAYKDIMVQSGAKDTLVPTEHVSLVKLSADRLQH